MNIFNPVPFKMSNKGISALRNKTKIKDEDLSQRREIMAELFNLYLKSHSHCSKANNEHKIEYKFYFKICCSSS